MLNILETKRCAIWDAIGKCLYGFDSDEWVA